jgi:type I restriction enzyme S subunit
MTFHTRKLGDLIHVKHGFAFASQNFTNAGPYMLLTPGNFHEAGGFKFRDAQKFYDGPVTEEFVLGPGDLLVAMTEQGEGLLGSAAFVPAGLPCLHNQRLGLIQAREGAPVDLRYIYYLFNSRPVRQQIRASATGAKIRHTAPTRIANVEVPIASFSEQQRIAEILGAYDDLIEVNRRRVALLEEMARGLYEEWFVRFRFPGHEDAAVQETSAGPLPSGWSWASFGDLVADVRDAIAPAAVDATTPYVGLEHMPRRSTTLDAYGAADEVTSTKLRFVRGDILFGKIRPYFHKVVWAPFEGVASSDAIVFRPRPATWPALALCIASSDPFVAHSVQTSNGTKMPRANPAVLKAYPIAIGPEGLMGRFERLIAPGIEQAAVLQATNQKLAGARDLLLPRLISGQLSVAQAELELAQAA